jgi:uncharacterized coiled-coil protein SlyX
MDLFGGRVINASHINDHHLDTKMGEVAGNTLLLGDHKEALADHKEIIDGHVLTLLAIGTLPTENKTLIDDHKGIIDGHTEALGAVGTVPAENRGLIDGNAENISDNAGDIVELEGTLAGQAQLISDLRGDVASNDQELASLQFTSTQHVNKIGELEGDMISVENGVGSNLSSINTHTGQIAGKLNTTSTTQLNMNSNAIINTSGHRIIGHLGNVLQRHYRQLELRHPNSTVSGWSLGAQVATPSTSDNDLYFSVKYSNGIEHDAGFIQDNHYNVEMNATIQHRCFYMGVYDDSMVGRIVCATGRYMNLLREGAVCSQMSCITINDSIPVVEICNHPSSNAVFGVVSNAEEDTRTWAAGNFVSTYDKLRGDNRLIVNGGGEGALWVSDAGGPLEIGDLVESYLDGYGRKQSDNIIRSSTVARITMACDFNPQPERVKIYRGYNEETKMIDWEYPVGEDGEEITELTYNCRTVPLGLSTVKVAFVGCVYLSS